MTGSEEEQAARLLERLLADPALRARFRSDPVAVAREAGLEHMDADAFGGSAMQTLEARESRSSLAGVMMAAALEGIAGFGLVQDAAAQGRDLPPEVNRVLARASAPSGAPSAPDAIPSPADLATPEGAAANHAGSQPAGVYPVVQAQNSGNGDPTGQDSGSSGDSSGQDSGRGGDSSGQDSGGGDSSGQDSGSSGSSGKSAGAAPDQAAPNQGSAGGNLGDAAAGYPGDGAPSAQIAGWMAREAQRNGLPPELPVMASLVESSMKNLPGGDLDSVGFFQMRMGIWNNGQYAGYSSKPQLQLKWFIDQALEVKKQRVAQGRSVTDPNQYGEWIADVERPAEQYRGRYQQHYQEARGLLAQAGAQGKSGSGGAQVAQVADAVSHKPVARAAGAGGAAPNAGVYPAVDPNSNAPPDPAINAAGDLNLNAIGAPNSNPSAGAQAPSAGAQAPSAGAQAPSAGTNAAANGGGSGNANAGNVPEDGGSGDTEAQADQESDGPGDQGDDPSGDAQDQDSGSGDPTGQDSGSGDPTGQDSGSSSDSSGQDSGSGSDSSGQNPGAVPDQAAPIDEGSSGANAGDAVAPGGSSGYVHPAPGNKPSSLDNGVDMETKPGTPLRAVGAGKIVTTQGAFPGGSIVLQLDHPVNGQKYIFYGHLDDANKKVSAGQRVAAGQVVANSSHSPPGAGDMPGHVEIGFAVDASGAIETGGAYTGDRSKGSPLGAKFNSFLKGLK